MSNLNHPWTAPDCSVVTAFAESAAGPGWGNAPVWVIWRDAERRLHQKCLQPAEQTAGMVVLYAVSAAAHAAMTAEVACGRWPT